MDDLVVAQVLESLEDLDSETPDEPEGDSLEVVTLNELIQIHGEQFEGDYEVLAEEEVVFGSDDVVDVVGVVFIEVLEDFELDASLVLELLLVPNNL